MLCYLAFSILAAAAAFASRSDRQLFAAGMLFYAVQTAFAVWIVAAGYGTTSAGLFTFDATGTLFYVLLTVVSCFAFIHSERYLKGENPAQVRIYSALLLLLAAATECETLTYDAVAAAAAHGKPLYLKTAFLLILCGYSCKVELFPLYTVGVDANFAAPAPASALISTGLVNAGFVALLRIYRTLAQTEVFPWVRSVLLIVGVLSLVIGALFLRRTNNYKRFLSYSTVENMGIAAIGLGIGGAGVWAAVFHVVCHTFIKSSLFLQMAVVRQIYNGYRINRIGDYIRINPVGAVGLLAGMVVLVAFPPSPLFLSELTILGEVVTAGKWWLVAGITLLLCIVIYSFCSRMIRLCYQPNQDELHPSKADRALSWSALTLLVAAMVLGLWQPDLLRQLLDQIASL